MPRTKYQKLQVVKTKHCEGKAKASDVTKAKNDYVADAVKKGQSKTEATRKADRVIKKKCSLPTAKVAGTKKKKATPKAKTASRRRRA